MADDTKRERDTDSPQAAAVDTIIRELASYAVLFAVSWAVLNRDAVWRMWTRLTRRPVTAAEAYARRMTAELRRDVAAWEHRGDKSPTVPGAGLYGDR